MSDFVSITRDKVLEEFYSAEHRLIRVWDVLGYASADIEHKTMLRIECRGGVVVKVRSSNSQDLDDLFRVRDDKIRPRWKVRPVEKHMDLRRLDLHYLWVRAPSYNLRNGKREQLFRYSFVDTIE